MAFEPEKKVWVVRDPLLACDEMKLFCAKGVFYENEGQLCNMVAALKVIAFVAQPFGGNSFKSHKE